MNLNCKLLDKVTSIGESITDWWVLGIVNVAQDQIIVQVGNSVAHLCDHLDGFPKVDSTIDAR